MEMKVERPIAASREKVWAALNDTETLKASIPGCDALEATSDTSFNAQITVKVGPVKAKFKFDVSLSDIDAPNSYMINGQGQGGAAGFANGSCAVTLLEDGEHTMLAYHAKANVGGKLAQLGSRLIDGTAQKMADEFFSKFISLVSDEQADDSGSEPAGNGQSGGDDKMAIPTWVLVAGLAIIAVLSVTFMT